MARRKAQTNKQAGSSTLRIIGGEWRSRKLPFVDIPGLRPTPDKIRETLFNWLQADIQGADCLDMFAGSGALGLEALSRGANSLVLVEKHPKCVTQLKQNLTLLRCENAQVLQTDALDFRGQYQQLSRASKSFDIVFLDPPYRQGLIEKSLDYLNAHHLLDANTLIYAEHEQEQTIDWQRFDLAILKQSSAGQVHSFLLRKYPKK